MCKRRAAQPSRLAALAVAVVAVGLASCSTGTGSSDVDTTTTTLAASTTTAAEGQAGEADTSTLDDRAGQRRSSTLTVAVAAPPSLLPWDHTCDIDCQVPLGAMFDRLFETDSVGRPVGWLATSATPNADFTVWTVRLRSGVVFHDGSAFDASTIVGMWEIQRESTVASALAAEAGLAAVEAIDETTVAYRLERPLSSFVDLLTTPTLGLVFNPDTVRVNGEDGADTSRDQPPGPPVGTGPYVAIVNDPGGDVALVRFDQYWYQAPGGQTAVAYDELRFVVEPSVAVRVAGLATGRFDVVAGSDVVLGDQTGRRVFTQVLPPSYALVFDTRTPPGDDPRVRTALAGLVDRQAALEASGGASATQWFAPGGRNFSPELAAAANVDPETAFGLLAEYIDDDSRSDGKEPGEPIDVEILCPQDDPLADALGPAVSGWTASSSISTGIRRVDRADFEASVVGPDAALDGTFAVACWSYGTNTEAVLDMLAFFGDRTTEPGNVTDVDAPALVELLESARQLPATARDEALETAATMAFEAAVAIPIAHPVFTIATDDSVAGLDGWSTPEGVELSGANRGLLRWHSVYPEDR